MCAHVLLGIEHWAFALRYMSCGSHLLFSLISHASASHIHHAWLLRKKLVFKDLFYPLGYIGVYRTPSILVFPIEILF